MFMWNVFNQAIRDVLKVCIFDGGKVVSERSNCQRGQMFFDCGLKMSVFGTEWRIRISTHWWPLFPMMRYPPVLVLEALQSIPKGAFFSTEGSTLNRRFQASGSLRGRKRHHQGNASRRPGNDFRNGRQHHPPCALSTRSICL